MKNLIKVLTICLAMVIAGCSDDNDDNTINSNTAVIKAHVQNSTWTVTRFIDSDVDETSDFTGYIFTFGESGILTADNGTTVMEGTWSITNDSNSSDDDPDEFNDIDFYIFFNTTNNFGDLNDDWDVVSYTESKIELMDISGGNGVTDLLTFEKN